MYNSLSCVPSNDADVTSYGDIFGFVCENADLCSGIAANGTTGTYGQFGMCSPKQQLGYVLNQYYSSRNADATACSFSGSAVVTQAASATGSCASQLSSVSSAGGSAGSASSSKGAASSNQIVSSNVGYITVAVMVQIALISGIGMIVL